MADKTIITKFIIVITMRFMDAGMESTFVDIKIAFSFMISFIILINNKYLFDLEQYILASVDRKDISLSNIVIK